jgi:hypothetical protein
MATPLLTVIGDSDDKVLSELRCQDLFSIPVRQDEDEPCDGDTDATECRRGCCNTSLDETIGTCDKDSAGLRGDQYTLIRLSKVEGTNILETLDKQIGTVTEVPNIEELSDGSWEICVLKSHCSTVQDTLDKIFPGVDIDLRYSPLEPTANDLKLWDYATAKELRQH